MPLKLGFDNYAIRALGWKADRILDYAESLGVDAVLFSDLDVFESHELRYLAGLKSKGDDLGLQLQVGTLSICPGSVLWSDRFGPPEQHLARTIRIAQALGSRVARCVLGKIDDRRSPGGIETRIEETVSVLKRVRSVAVDAGVKIAVENHAGDMRAKELVGLIEAAGSDFVGATMDSGNAVWALEDPLENLELLGKFAICTGVRDSMIWPSEDGAVLQWTAMGEGVIDFRAYFRRFAELCPETPVQLETISGRPMPIPYRREDFWEVYPNVTPHEFAKFIGLVQRGRPIAAFKSGGAGESGCSEGEFQKQELERSVQYCRDVLGLGKKRKRGA